MIRARRRARWLAPLSAGPLVVGTCTSFHATESPFPPPDAAPAADASAPDTADVSPDAVGDGAPTLPRSCADAHERGGAVVDVDVVIDIDGPGPEPPSTVWCRDITSAPKEYLTLVNTTDPVADNAMASGSNIAGWAMGPGAGATSCLCTPDAVRAFTRARLVISGSKLQLDLRDITFSRTNRPSDQPSSCELQKAGSCQFFGSPAQNLGAGSSCIEAPTPLGRGNVDLRETAFHVASTESGTTVGFAAQGTTEYLPTVGPRKLVEVHGGGSCGTQSPGSDPNFLDVELD